MVAFYSQNLCHTSRYLVLVADGHENRHALRCQIVQHRFQLLAVRRIEPGAWIVQYQQRGICQQRARQEHAARLAVG